MDRRTFLTQWASRPTLAARPGNTGSTSNPRTLATGLEPYVPTAEAPWDALRAGHLLRRTTMMPRWQDIQTLLALSPSDAVDLILNTPSEPLPPTIADKTTESLDGLDTVTRNQVQAGWRSDAAVLRKWYSELLAATNISIIEKLTLFWHGHFTSEFEFDEAFVLAPLLYRQNRLFRLTGLGDFKELAFNITLDGGMLVYLGGDLNNKRKANENYARELLELYTTGLGHYTEGDIHEAARILTGWHTAQYHDKPAPNGIFNAYFIPSDHDTGAKEFFGVTFSAIDGSTNTEFLVKDNEIRKLIDTIFEKEAEAVAMHLSRRLYRFFVYSNPADSDESVIAEMAQLMIASEFQIKPVLAALFKSAHFFDNANLGAQIKTPAELVIGMGRQFGFLSNMANNMGAVDEILFDPPNVSGWTGYRDWITTYTYPLRSKTSDAALAAMTQNATIDFIKSFPDYDIADTFLDNLAAVLLPRRLSPERKEAFIAILTNNGPGAYVWEQAINQSPATAAGYFKNLLTTISQLPDFQLC